MLQVSHLIPLSNIKSACEQFINTLWQNQVRGAYQAQIYPFRQKTRLFFMQSDRSGV
jgi:hypothetical protein